jgi:hypothetical protein
MLELPGQTDNSAVITGLWLIGALYKLYSIE